MIDFLLRPLRRNFGKDKIYYRAIDDMFGFIPHNIELYKLALIHKSASVTLDNGRHINNERLEYLGDAVIETVTSDYLFIEFPDKSEGFLTQMRSKMVSRQSLNAVAKRIGLDEHVITHSTNNSAQKHIFGDAFEAMMGAIYLDQGYDFVNRLLINNIFTKHLKLETLIESETDFKSRLIEWCQKKHHSIQFQTSHDKTYSSSNPFFYSKVLIDDIEVGYGAGESKKEAEQRAAFSVSQGFNDNDYNKLMDKLDVLDSHHKSSEKPSPKPSKPRKEPKPTADKPSTEATAKPKEEPLTETTADITDTENTTAEAKPKRQRRQRRTSKPQVETAAEQQPSNETSTAEVTSTATPSQSEETSEESQPKEARARRPRRRRSTKKEGSATDTTTDGSETSVANTDNA